MFRRSEIKVWTGDSRRLWKGSPQGRLPLDGVLIGIGAQVKFYNFHSSAMYL